MSNSTVPLSTSSSSSIAAQAPSSSRSMASRARVALTQKVGTSPSPTLNIENGMSRQSYATSQLHSPGSEQLTGPSSSSQYKLANNRLTQKYRKPQQEDAMNISADTKFNAKPQDSHDPGVQNFVDDKKEFESSQSAFTLRDHGDTSTSGLSITLDEPQRPPPPPPPLPTLSTPLNVNQEYTFNSSEPQIEVEEYEEQPTFNHQCSKCGNHEKVAIPKKIDGSSGEQYSSATRKALADFRETLQQEKWLRKKDKSIESFALASQAKTLELEAECNRLRGALTEQLATNRTLYHNFLEALDECQKRVQEADLRVAESRKEHKNEEAKVTFMTNLCDKTRAELQHVRKCFIVVTQRLCVNQLVKNYRTYHQVLRVLELVANLREVVFGPGGLGPENLPTSELLELYENNTRFRKRFNAFKNFRPGNNVRRPKAAQLINLLQDSLEEFVIPLRRLTTRVNNLCAVNDAFFKRNIALSATTQQAKERAAALREEIDEVKLKLGQTEQQILKFQHYQPSTFRPSTSAIAPISKSDTLKRASSSRTNTLTTKKANLLDELSLRQQAQPQSAMTNLRNGIVMGPTTASVNIPAIYRRTPFVPIRIRGSATLNWQSQNQD